MAVVQTLFSPLRLMRGGGRKKCEEKSSPPAKVTARNGTDKVAAAAPATDYGGREERLRGQRWRRQNHPRQQRRTSLQRRRPRRPCSGRFVLGAAVASLGLSLVFLFAYLSVTMHHLHHGGGRGGGGGMRGYIGVDRLIRREQGGVHDGGGDDVLQQLKKREEGHTWKRLQQRIQRRPLLERKEPDRSEDYPLRELGRPLTDEEVGRANNSTLPDPALLILAYNRPTYLKQQLVRLRNLPRRSNFAVYVSQDGNETSAAEMIRRGPDKTKLCGDGNVGIGICPVRTSCCSKHGWCGTTESHCGPPGDRPCGEGKVGNGVCPGAEDGVCCSKHGWCGTTQSHCGDQLGGERKKDGGGPTEKKQVETVADVILSNSDFVTHLVHPRVAVPDQPGTAYLARHYKWALDQMFLVRNHSHVVIAEDDLLFAPDFLRLFEQTGHLLDVEPTLWCVSSWNDLGPHRFATDPRALRRTDYFPGLGWMLRRELWVEELSDTFPTDAWDHWMRLDTVSRGRSCIFPEVSRNFNIGSGAGTTVKGGFYQRYIRHNRVAREDVVDFGDLDYLRKDNYDRMLADMIGRAVVVENPTAKEIQGWVAPPRNVSEGAGSDANANAKNGTDATPGVVDAEDEEVVRFVPYTTETYKDVVAKPLRIIPSPRTRYRGITVLHVSPRGHLLVGDVRAVEEHDGVSSSLIPSSLRFKVDPGFRAVPAGVGESCDDACSGQAGGGGRADPGQRNSGTVQRLRCSDDHFAFVNRCSTLMKHFPCERGCWGSVIGPDVPNYVPGAGGPIDESSVTNTTNRVGANTTTTEGKRGGNGNATSINMAGYCLTTEGVPRCDASHVSTARICPCVPVKTVSVLVPAR